MPKHVVIVGYQDLMSLDLTGPLEAFSSAQIKNAKGATEATEPGYKVTIAALGAKSFSSESGLRITAACLLSSVRKIDTLIIPGGRGMREAATSARLSEWIKNSWRDIRRIATVCTGIYGLAPTGNRSITGADRGGLWSAGCTRRGTGVSGVSKTSGRAGTVFRAVEISGAGQQPLRRFGTLDGGPSGR